MAKKELPNEIRDRLDGIEIDIRDLKEPGVEEVENRTSHIAYLAMRTYIDVLEENKTNIEELACELAVVMQGALLDCYSGDKKRGQKVMVAFVEKANSPTLTEAALWEED